MGLKSFIDKHRKLWEIFKFLLIGGVATLLDFFVMGIVKYLFEPSNYGNNFIKAFYMKSSKLLPNILGTGLGFIAGLIFNYIFSIIFVFIDSDTKSAKSVKGFIYFTLLSAVGLGIHLLGMYIGNDLLKINEWIVKIILTLVVLVFNYLTRKFLLFNKPKTEQNKEQEELKKTNVPPPEDINKEKAE